MSHAPRRLVIVGGGPAGLVAAIAARRAGFDCAIYEQAAGFGRVGGAVGIQSNGLHVLAALDLLEAFRKHIEFTFEACVEAPPGRTLCRADFREVAIPHNGFAVALRHDLHEILAAAARDLGAELHFDARCTGAEWRPDGVRLSFSNGGTTEAPLLFACDGIHSVVREQLGFKSQKRVTGEAFLRLTVPIAHPQPSRIGEYWHPDGRRAGAFPLPGNRTYVFCSVPLGRWRTILQSGLDDWRRGWDGFGDPIATLMRAMPDWPSAVHDELADLRVDRWHRNGVFLLGDAAHAMTPNLGQGANSAMVDALVLVNLLVETAASRDWHDAGRRYEQVRRPFVTRIQDVARRGGVMAAWTHPLARAVRDQSLRTLRHVAPLRRASLRLTAGYNPAELPFLRAPNQIAW